MTYLRNLIIKLFWFCIGFYGFVVTLYTVLKVTIGERFMIIGLLNNGGHLLWASTIILMIPAIIFRRFRVMTMMLIPTLAFTINYLPMYFSRTATPPPNAQSLKVMTYNINLAPSSPHQIAEDIKRVDADIVAIQELTHFVAEIFEQELADQYPYRAFHPVNSFHGQGVMSKYPIISDEYWHIYLGHQRVGIDINGMEVTLYSVHPVHHLVRSRNFDIRYRTEEVNVFLDKAAQDTTPILIMGDMNMTDQSGDYQRITQTYHDSYREVGYGMGTTFPENKELLPPLVRIDYVFHSDEFTALEANVLRSSGGSDHRPLVVKLALEKN